jgi:PhzF family phenazine biosynthesis protein
MRLRTWIVDAFAEGFGQGNPAGVVLLEEAALGLGEEGFLRMARELGHSETAFVSVDGGPTSIRWFSPVKEMPICGHATMAAAAVLFGLEPDLENLDFRYSAGVLSVRKGREGRLEMTFPLDGYQQADLDPSLLPILGLTSGAVIDCIRGLSTGKVILVLRPDTDLGAITPDFPALRASRGIHTLGIGLTKRGQEHDCESRYFNPWAGVDEDPVTGSVHLVLARYWGEVLGKPRLLALQASQRPGLLELTVKGDRVVIGGKARIALRGEMDFDAGSSSPSRPYGRRKA